MTFENYDINPHGYHEIVLPVTDDTALVLVNDFFGGETDWTRRCRNVYYVDKDRRVIWQIRTEVDHLVNNPFREGPFIDLDKIELRHTKIEARYAPWFNDFLVSLFSKMKPTDKKEDEPFLVEACRSDGGIFFINMQTGFAEQVGYYP